MSLPQSVRISILVLVIGLFVGGTIYFGSRSKVTTPETVQPSAQPVAPAIPGPSKFPSETKVIASGDRQLEFVKKNFSKLSSAGITATLREKPLSDESRPANSNQIRYFHPEDKQEAVRIAQAVRDAFGVDVPDPKLYDDDRAPHGYIEVWIARIP